MLTPQDAAELIERLSSVLSSQARLRWAALGLHPVHGRILVYLAHCNRYSDTMTALVEYLGSTKGTVSQSLELLVERGLVARRTDAKDLRVAHLSLTDEGRRTLATGQADPAWQAAIGNNDGTETLSAALTALLSRLQQGNGRRSFGSCHTCRHHRKDGSQRLRCGLTGEALAIEDRARWCREHEEIA